MSWLFTPYLFPILVAAAISIGLAIYGWQRRAITGATAFVLLMAAIAEWSLAYAMELSVPGLPAKMLWVKAEYLGIVTLPAAWLVFALQYSDSPWWRAHQRRIISALALGPLITLSLAWTNERHHLIWQRIELDTGTPFPTLSLTYGGWFWINVAVSYILLVWGTVILLREAFHLQTLYRRQAAAIMLAVLIPWLGNALYIFGPELVPNLDLTPFAFTLTGVVLAWAIFRFRLFQIMPVALRPVFDGMGDGVIVLDTGNRVIDLNPEAQRILGVDAANVIGQPAADVLARWPHLIERFRDVTQIHTELSLPQGGKVRHYSLYISPLFDNRKRSTGRLLVFRDITERKEWEITLQQERDMFVSGSVVVFKWQNRENWPVEYVSANVKEIFGYPAEEFLQGSVLYADLVHPDDTARVAGEVTTFSQSGVERFEHQPYRLIHQNGETVWVLDYTTILRDEAGRITHYLGYIVDITAQVKAEEERRGYQQRLEMLYCIVADLNRAGTLEEVYQIAMQSVAELLQADRSAVLIFGPDERVHFVAYQNLSQSYRQKVDGHSPWQVYETNAQPIFIANVSQSDLEESIKEAVLAEGIQAMGFVPLASSHRLVGKFMVYYNRPYVCTDEGEHLAQILADNVAAIVLRVQALEESRRAEEALRESNQRLTETLVELQETQERLVQRERLAAVGQLTAGIAHDFNNILTGILGFAELLQMSPNMPEAAREDLRRIANSGQRAARLVRQLLDFSRKSIRQPRLLDLIPFFKEMVQFLRRTIPENIHLNLEIEPGDYKIEADLTQFQQLFTNLVINARDAMPDGGQLRLLLARVAAAGEAHCAVCQQPIVGEWIQLQVMDTGSGIVPAALPHIFEPFFTTKEVGEGSGLGLSQVAGIVGQHEGHLTVESEPGQGTTFSIYLPPSTEKKVIEKSVEPSQLAHGHGKTILLVEDDPVVREVSLAVLESLNYQVLTAVNGKEALAVYAKYKDEIILVLSDMIMPDMDGVALFNILKTRKPDIKMVIMSGYPLEEKGAELLEQGVVAWLQKPMSVLQLSQVISQVVGDNDSASTL